MKDKPFDFLSKYRDPVVFMTDVEWRSLNSRTICGGAVIGSIKVMTDDEFKETIVEDVLSVTMYERQSGNQVSFDMGDLFCLLTRQDFTRASRLFRELLNELIIVNDRKPRIQPGKLEAAMNYCGVFYEL